MFIRDRYTYRINELGNPYISSGNGLTMLEADDGEYTKGGKTFKTVEVDMYYGRNVILIYKDNRYSDYFFDGLSNVWVKDKDDGTYTEKAYTYEIVTSDLCEIIDADGVRYNGKMARSGMNIEFEVTDQLEVVMNGATYLLGVGTVWTKDDDGYTKAYNKSNEIIKDVDREKIKKFDVTDAEGGEFTAVVVYDVVIGNYVMALTRVEEETEGTGEQA